MRLLSVEGLTVALPPGGDRAHAVEDISLHVDRGEILCVVGESGSGKSITANAVMGLLPKALPLRAGRIMLEENNLTAQSPEQLRRLRGTRMAMIFQEPMTALNPLMRVGDQIAEALAVHGEGARARDRVPELLAAVNLPDPASLARAHPFRLSGGQRQRVMIAMALALEPALLIADEPTTALDVTTQMQILRLIRDIQSRRGMGVMFITHDFGVVAEIADRVAVMQRGRIVEQGRAVDVLNNPQHAYTRALIAAVPHGAAKDSAANTGPLVLQAMGLQKTYRRGGWFGAKSVVRAVHDADFTLRQGETLDLVDESASGNPRSRAAWSIWFCRSKVRCCSMGRICARCRVPRGSRIASVSRWCSRIPTLRSIRASGWARSSPRGRSRMACRVRKPSRGPANCCGLYSSMPARWIASRMNSPAVSASASASRAHWRWSLNY